MLTYEKKQHFSPVYTYQKFPRPSQKFWERSQATEQVFWVLEAPKFWTGILSKVNLEGYEQDFCFMVFDRVLVSTKSLFLSLSVILSLSLPLSLYFFIMAFI